MRQEPRSDGDLLTAVADRDREALRELYDRHAPWLRARLARRCGDQGVVEEVQQDTVLAVWRTPTGYRGTGRGGRQPSGAARGAAGDAPAGRRARAADDAPRGRASGVALGLHRRAGGLGSAPRGGAARGRDPGPRRAGPQVRWARTTTSSSSGCS